MAPGWLFSRGDMVCEDAEEKVVVKVKRAGMSLRKVAMVELGREL